MATEPIKDKKQLKALAGYWLSRKNYRNYVLIVLGVCTALRISDLLRLKWADVYDFEAAAFRSRFTVIEGKTGKTKTVALNPQAVQALGLYFLHRKGKYIFSNNRKNDAPIGRVQAWRIVKEAVAAVEIAGRIAAHSLRKTFGFFAWKAGVLPVMLMDIYNHTSFETTKRYLGIAQEERDKIYLSMSLF